MAKLHYCLLEKFNNYFNRKIFKYSTLQDYQDNSNDFLIPSDSEDNPLPFDFNPNDNVMTEIIVNNVSFTPDYFLLFDSEENIISRWFVIEERRNRQGQWIYSLRRDVIADNLESLLTAPIFVHKGMLKENDTFIYNDEGMNFNQVKREEHFITDETQSAWIVGYMAKNTDGTDISLEIPSEAVQDAISLADIATALGTTEGVLTPLLNFDETINNYICFANTVNFKFRVYLADPISISDYGVLSYVFGFDSFINFRNFIEDDYQVGPYLLKSLLSKPEYYHALETQFPQIVESYKVSLLSQISSIVSSTYYFNQDKLTALKAFQGKTIYYNSKYYKINIVESGEMTQNSGELAPNIYTSLENIANDTANISGGQFSDDPKYIDIEVIGNQVSISLNEVSASDVIPTYVGSISASRVETSDQEYDIFMIPYADKLSISYGYIEGQGYQFITNSQEIALKTASQIARTLGKELYDIQLLPYSIIDYGKYGYVNLDSIKHLNGQVAYNLIGLNQTQTGTIELNNNTLNESYLSWRYTSFPPVPPRRTYIRVEIYLEDLGHFNTTSGNINSVTFTAGEGVTSWYHPDSSYEQYTDGIVILNFELTTEDVPPTDDFKFSIEFTYTDPQDTPATVIIYSSTSSFQKYTEHGKPTELNNSGLSLKILSNAYYLRLCSPNYQGSFDINIGRNNGKIKGYWLYGTYKPYTPYIKVAPVFEGLYGSNFGDQRGLICSGDFSLPRIIDEWQNFQLNNKNYQNIFNREIQNMEFMQSLERRNQIVSGIVGILGDTTKGATAGGVVGGPWGAIAGGVIGGATSGIGFGIDVDTLAKTQREQKSLAIDKFNYQLGNIKALPYTLTSIGAFNINSKIFPFLEIYTPTEKELEAFEKKIEYESMTVMRIDNMINYYEAFDKKCYFKGELIRCDEIAEDYHMLESIYAELMKGVYI